MGLGVGQDLVGTRVLHQLVFAAVAKRLAYQFAMVASLNISVRVRTKGER